MKIRHACHDDLDTIMSVYQHAKKVMDQSGNPGQWVNGYLFTLLGMNQIITK